MKFSWLFIVALIVGMSACNSGKDAEVREEARASLENTTVVSPNASGAMASEVEDPFGGPTTTIEWETKRYDFGDVVSGDKVKNVFKFTNTGDEPLIITDVKASCGCTAPSWPKEPVAPGESAEIEAIFDTAGKSGAQTKSITVTANTEPSSTVLILEGLVNKS